MINISGMTNFPEEFFTEVGKYDLSSYYINHLEVRTKFFKKLQPNEIMRWSSDLLSKPLTKLPSNLTDFAFQLFKSK